MEHLLASLAELVGFVALSATYRGRAHSKPVGVAVAAGAFVLVGAVLGAPAAILVTSLPTAITVGLVLSGLVLLLTALKMLGVPVGASRSLAASAVYAGAFYIGAFGLLALLRTQAT